MFSNPESDLLLLPHELLLHLFEFFDVKSLLTCRQVCRQFRDIVDESPQCQYKLELLTAGLDDGPAPIQSISDRRASLKQYTDSWNDLKWAETSRIELHPFRVWEIFGGVLAQYTHSKTFTFTRLPGVTRGIQEKTWTADKLPFRVRDFGIDPAQDLWAVIEKPTQSQPGMFQTTVIENQVHLLSLEKAPGAPHPLAKGGHIISFTHNFVDPHLSFTLQISGDFIGILATTFHAGQNEFLVWNWKTGERLMCLLGDEMRSFLFLSDRHVLLALYNHDETGVAQPTRDIAPTLAIVNFTEQPTGDPQFVLGTKMITLWYPPLRDNVGMVSFEVRSDPSPSWQPDQSSGVPFYLAKMQRLYVVSLRVIVEGETMPDLLLLFVSSRTLMNIANSCEEELKSSNRVDVAWGNWGPGGTRMMISPVHHSRTYVCYVHGTRYVALEARQRGLGKIWCRVYDFNDLPLRRGQTKVYEENVITEDREICPHICDTVVYQAGPTTIKGGRIFRYDVTTSSPFRWKSVDLDIPASERDQAVMCSEDNIIVVDEHDVHYHILTF